MPRGSLLPCGAVCLLTYSFGSRRAPALVAVGSPALALAADASDGSRLTAHAPHGSDLEVRSEREPKAGSDGSAGSYFSRAKISSLEVLLRARVLFQDLGSFRELGWPS